MQEGQEVVLITGASGFIGSALIRRLAGHYRLVGLTRQGNAPAPAEGLAFDLSSGASVRQTLEQVGDRFGRRIAAVIHLAAYYDLSGRPSPRYREITVRGTERLLRALAGFEVEQFIFTSTMLVHAPVSPGQHINESSPLRPAWAYPRSKLHTEELLPGWSNEMPIVILRLAGVYDDLGHLAFLTQQIARIHERQLASHLYPGDPRTGQAALHVDDLAEAVARLIEVRARLPRTTEFLLGEPDTLSYADLQHEIGRLLHGEAWVTRELPKSLARTGAMLQGWLEPLIPGRIDSGEQPFVRPWMIDQADNHYALDISRARNLLGWEPQHRLREALPRIVDALKTDPAAWYRSNGLPPSAGLA